MWSLQTVFHTGWPLVCKERSASAKQCLFVLLQMAVWIPSSQKIYVAPTPVTTIPSTDEFIRRTDHFYHATSDRLLTVGHPFFSIQDAENKTIVPKVSGSQYRVFRIKLPDPNKFALPEPSVFDPDTERLVWCLRGLEVGRGGPLGMGITGNPFFARNMDAENPNAYERPMNGNAVRYNVAMEPKQTQMLIVGCVPAEGEYWGRTLPCASGDTPPNLDKGKCPALELRSTVIEDGTMIDIGFGHMDFRALQEDKSGAPIDISGTKSVYPDWLKMAKDVYGNSCFFSVRKEQTYTRHYFTRTGVSADKVPESMYYVRKPDSGTRGSIVYYGTPSGSIVTTEGQVHNRPYWLLRGQGQNNGVLWGNQCFITVVDNTRGLNFTINAATDAAEDDNWQATNYNNYVRHVEEYEISMILQLCAVPLNPATLTLLNGMDPNILEDWEIGVNPTVSGDLSDTYRYITSLATRCPDKDKKEKVDPYAKYTFWDLDFTERLSSDLQQFPLGRRFRAQSSRTTTRRVRTPTTVVKRRSTTITKSAPKTVAAKRRRR
ncbi:L1 [Eidolon helvum papillomavirus 3]|uniref:Major capsid protein L1 n=1 Tax=Eidolon helvum papillomavirus 3 TaxID=1335477 RepID=A0A1P8YVV5_9PAPI|nr:L1 [Eidolon helvum papillomavirus 3]AQA28214.1 L1 [Eidolon helvum papillomavirus 3]